MTDSPTAGIRAVHHPQEVDPRDHIDALRARRADRFDPVAFRFIEALAQRAATARIGTRRALDRKVAKALADFRDRFDRAGLDATAALARGAAHFPEAADVLRQHFDACDFSGLHRLLARLEAQTCSGPLAELLAHIARHAPESTAGAPTDAAGAAIEPRGELRSLKHFRSTWSRLSIDRQLSHAFAQAPENAGPLNSHFLVLQSLRLMRDISPEYLEQFMSYVDTLLWLDQPDGNRGPAQKNPVRGERDKKRKSGRSNAS